MANTAETTWYTIQEVSRRSGLPEPTLRYYEKIGLIGPVARDPSSGMSVEDLRAYLRDLGDGSPARLRELFRRNAERVDAEIARLRVRRAYLQAKADLWDARVRRDEPAENAAIDEVRDILSRF